MRYTFLSLVFLLAVSFVSAQEKPPNVFSVEADFFTGSILEHNPDISHLISEHPSGVILSYNRKTFGFREAERRYNYPDWGFTFAYQDFKSEPLGKNLSLYGHFNWYFLNRHLVARFGQGIAYNTNPYDPETNFLNNAFGSSLLSTTFLKANYVDENVYDGFGFHAGFTIIHYSNANLKAPNSSTNTWAFNAGVSYLVDHENVPSYDTTDDGPGSSHAEKIKYNLVLRGGVNESDVVGSGQFPFLSLIHI